MEQEINHIWVNGKYKRDGWHFVREDTCALCGCKRVMIKFWFKSKKHEEAISYVRSKIIFSDRMPECWGAKNPQ